MLRIAIIAGVCFVLCGCAARLGETSYPKAVLDEYEGSWEAVGEDTQDRGTVRLVVDVARGENKYPPGERPIGVQPDRYYVTVRFEGTGKAVEGLPTSPIELEGEFVKSHRWTLFTFQPGLKHQWAWEALVFSAPLQQTMRVEKSGDDLVLYTPRVQLVYVPVKMAGTLDFKAPARPAAGEPGGRLLVQKMDDVIATLDRAEAEDWSEPMRLVRVK